MRRYPLVVGLLACYLVHLSLKFGRVPVPWFFSHYFADLLCMPLLLSLVVIGMRNIKKEPNLYLPWPMILVAVLYVGVVFEYWLPHYWPRYTADVFDLLMYGVGGLGFYFFQARLLLAVGQAFCPQSNK